MGTIMETCDRKGMTNLIFVPDFMILLKYVHDIPEASLTNLHKATNLSPPHILKIYHLAADKRLLMIKKDGYKVNLSLTEKGKEVVRATNILFDALEINNDNLQDFRTGFGRNARGK